jgi:hypothetical protein
MIRRIAAVLLALHGVIHLIILEDSSPPLAARHWLDALPSPRLQESSRTDVS